MSRTKPHRMFLALAFAILIWVVGFVWGSVVFMTPSLTLPPIPYVSTNPAISFPIMITWLLLAYLLARIYLKPASDRGGDGFKLGFMFALVNIFLDLIVLVVLLGTGLRFFASLTLWLAYLILLLVPWITARSMQAAAAA